MNHVTNESGSNLTQEKLIVWKFDSWRKMNQAVNLNVQNESCVKVTREKTYRVKKKKKPETNVKNESCEKWIMWRMNQIIIQDIKTNPNCWKIRMNYEVKNESYFKKYLKNNWRDGKWKMNRVIRRNVQNESCVKVTRKKTEPNEKKPEPNVRNESW